MLISFPVACPHEDCDWSGNLVPSVVQGWADVRFASGRRAGFRCPRCRRDWMGVITDDRVVVLPAVEFGG